MRRFFKSSRPFYKKLSKFIAILQYCNSIRSHFEFRLTGKFPKYTRRECPKNDRCRAAMLANRRFRGSAEVEDRRSSRPSADTVFYINSREFVRRFHRTEISKVGIVARQRYPRKLARNPRKLAATPNSKFTLRDRPVDDFTR